MLVLNGYLLYLIFLVLGTIFIGIAAPTEGGVNGDLWVASLLADLPGGELGFLLFVSVLTFLLAFFLDFFELAFILVPLLAPVADSMGIDLIWFGVLLAVNMQTSFMHPPFGFSLFYLRSVAPKEDYIDKPTGKKIARVKTSEIYLGSIPFIVIQLFMVGLVLFVPSLVTHYKGALVEVDLSTVNIEMTNDYGDDNGYGYGDGDEEIIFK